VKWGPGINASQNNTVRALCCRRNNELQDVVYGTLLSSHLLALSSIFRGFVAQHSVQRLYDRSTINWTCGMLACN